MRAARLRASGARGARGARGLRFSSSEGSDAPPAPIFGPDFGPDFGADPRSLRARVATSYSGAHRAEKRPLSTSQPLEYTEGAVGQTGRAKRTNPTEEPWTSPSTTFPKKP